MTDTAHDLLASAGLPEERARAILGEALAGADDGELFLEYRQSESLVFDNGRLKGANYDTTQGFGLRAVAGEAAGYAHSGEISEAALKRAADAVAAVASGHSGTYAAAPQRTNARLYVDDNPLQAPVFADKVELLQTIDAYARACDPKVRQVSVSLACSWQVVDILRADGYRVRDIRPLVRFGVSVVAGDGSPPGDRLARVRRARHGRGLRHRGELEGGRRRGIAPGACQSLEAVPAPAGSFDVVLGAGWPGILLHEAVGHGLEGDFNRKKTSAFAGLMGRRVASKGVTIVDDGTIGGRRGSLTIDDEGTPSGRTVLIEDGILTGYMQDRQNARLMGTHSTGNGRRQSFAHIPMPRMTNTVMLGGDSDPREILEGVKDGIYAVSFGGGQVDITSGKFVFSCTEAYRVENGRVGAPLKGAMLIGNGPDALTRISAIGNDMALDPGIGTCGKQGQGVPVGVGQPTLRINAMTIGGTAV